MQQCQLCVCPVDTTAATTAVTAATAAATATAVVLCTAVSCKQLVQRIEVHTLCWLKGHAACA
jgi:hypothetical protein